MKLMLAGGVLVSSVALGFGQGTVVFNNRLTGSIVTHVWWGYPRRAGNSSIDTPSGSTSYGSFPLVGGPGGPNAATTFASLLGAPGANAPIASMQVGSLGTALGDGTATTFRTGGAAGQIVGATATFSNIPADAPVATFQMVVWDNQTGLFSTWALARVAYESGNLPAGYSDPFVVTTIGGGTNSPPYLAGLMSFSWGGIEYPPIITQQPTNQAAVLGGQAAFSVGVFNYPNLPTRYQWYFNNSAIVGATNLDFTLNNLQAANFGPYFATVLGFDPWYYQTSVTAQLTYAINPSLSISRLGPTSVLSFPTEVGPKYAVEYKTNLADPAWTRLTTNNGTGSLIQVFDGPASPSSRFYRVRMY